MGCCSTFGRIFLVVFNVIFVVLGLAMLVVGIIFKVDSKIILESDIYHDNLAPLLQKVELPGGFDLIGLLDSLSLFVIILGAVIFLIGFLGCCGACCKIKWMLIIYAILVILILVAQIALVVLFAIVKNDAETELKNTLTTELKVRYKSEGMPKQDDISDAFNYMFSEIKCCGVDGVADMKNTAWYKDTTPTPTLDYPLSCCKNYTKQSLVDKKCDKNGHSTEGCYDVIRNSVMEYSTVFIGVGSGLLAFELLCIIFAFCVCRDVEKDSIV